MRRSSVLIFALLAVTAGWMVWPRGSVDRVGERGPTALERPEVVGLESEPSLPELRPVGAPEKLSSSEGVAVLVEGAQLGSTEGQAAEAPSLDALVEALVEEERKRPETFGSRAPPLLDDFVAALGGAFERPAEELRAVLEGRDLTPPVRGALVALWGAMVPSDLLVAWVGSDLEERRGMWLGLTAAWTGLPVDGLELDIDDFLRVHARPEPSPPLRFRLARLPDETLEQVLLGELLRTADDWDGVLDRHLVTLALGVGVDARDHVFETFASLLFDESLLGRQVRVPLLFVLTRSPRERSKELVRRYLREAEDGDLAKDFARHWLAESGDVGLTVTEMLAPLVDVTDPMAAMIAATSLGKWITSTEAEGGTVSAQDMQYAQDTLAAALDTQTDENVRLGAVGTLAYSMRGGFTRLDSLRQVLEGGDDALLRRMAIDGLARTEGALRQEALSVLRARVGHESDPELAALLDSALAAANSGEG